MWRAFFLAVGVTLCILGVECMVLDKAVMASRGRSSSSLMSDSEYDTYGFEIDSPAFSTAEPREFVPPEWAPWSLLSTGSIILLYALMRQPRGD